MQQEYELIDKCSTNSEIPDCENTQEKVEKMCKTEKRQQEYNQD
jgi:hypothetical protein